MIGMYNSAISDAGGDAVPRRGGLATLLGASRSSVCAMLAAASSLSWATQLPPGAHLVEVIEPPPQGQAKSSLSPNQVELTGNIAVLELDADYDAALPDGQANVAVRRDVAQAVLAQGQAGPDDRYDFIVVFTDFPVDLGDGVAGLNWSVRNDVSGIGRPIYDNSAAFGSTRLQSYVDMRNALSTPVAAGSAEEDQVLDTLMHELMHQWGSHLRIDAPGLPAEALLGRNQSHWSALLSTDASVMYGARWQLLPDGRARSIGVREHYGPLDLYAAGWLALDEVPEFQLLQSTELAADALPQLGLEIAATAIPLNIGQVIAANGPRNPDSFSSQKHFRAALVLLRRSGSPLPSPQLDRLEAFRLRAQDRFAAITLGRASLLLGFEVAPAQGQTPSERAATQTCGGAGQPACESGVTGARDWLLATQRADGSWADKPQTAVRDSLAAVEALLAMSPEGSPEIDQALAWLEAAQPADVEQQILLFASGLVSLAREAELAELIASTRIGVLRPSFGAQGSRQPSTMESAQVLLASVRRQARGGQALAETSALVDFLLERLQPNPATNPPADAQRCWSRESRGPCDALAAAAALEGLLAAGLSPADMADYRGVLLGFEADPLGVNVAQSLRLLHALGLSDDPRSQVLDQQLRAAQRPNGSWADSATATAESILWLLSRNLPDLLVSSELQWGSDETFAGLPLRLQFSISNAGGVEADPVRALLEIRAEAAPDHAPWQIIGELMTPPLPVAASSAMQFDWDTSGVLHGSYRLRLSLDSEQTLTELNELNNQDERAIDLAERPMGSDLLVLPGAMVSPQVLDRVPLTVSVRADVMNLGQSDAAESVARVYALRFGELLPLAEQSIALPAGERQLLQIDAVIADPDVSAVRLVLDAEQSVVESNEGNNSVDLALLSEPAVDLEVRAEDLSVGPVGVEQGQAVQLSVMVHNRGTRLSPVFKLRLSVRDQSGEERDLLQQDIQIGAADAALRQYSWTADRSGLVDMIVRLDPADLVTELREDNNQALIQFVVSPSSRPNLSLVPASVTIAPDPPLEGSDASLSVQIANSSTVSSPPSDIAVYLNNPDQPDATVWGAVAVPEVPAQSTIQVVVPLGSRTGSGQRLLYIRVDPENLLAEASESDNDLVFETDIRALADLEVRSASLTSVPSSPAPGSSAELAVVVRNLGQQPTGEFGISLELTVDGQIIDGLPPQSIPGLAAGASQVAHFTYTRPITSGEFALRVQVDANADVSEGDEENNTATLIIGELNPSLYVTEPFISPNGDGIKDSTEIVARVAEPQDLRVRIVSSWGEEVFRAQGGELSQTTIASLEWNGMRQDGLRAFDDVYSVRIETEAGDLVGMLSVTVDTNNSPLLKAFQSGHDRYVGIGSECSSQGTRRSPSPEDPYHEGSQGLISYWEPEPGDRALFNSPLDGRPARRIVRLNDLHLGAITTTQRWITTTDELAVLLIAQEGAGLVYELHVLDPGNPDLRRLVWSSTMHPGFYLMTIDQHWAVFRSDAGVAGINLQTGEQRQLASMEPTGILAASDSGALFKIDEALFLHVDVNGSHTFELDALRATAIPLSGSHRYIIATSSDPTTFESWYFDRLFLLDPDASSPVFELDAGANHDASLHIAESNEEDEFFLLQTNPPMLSRWHVDDGRIGEVELSFAFVPPPESNSSPEPGVRFRRGFRNVHYSPARDRWYFEAILIRDSGNDGAYEYLDTDNVIVNPLELSVHVLPDLGRRTPESWSEFPRWVVGETQLLGYQSGLLARRGMILLPAFAETPTALYTSPSAESMLLNRAIGATSGCEAGGLGRVYSSANLTASLKLEYEPAYSAFLLVASAEDENLAGYRIDARRRDVPGVAVLTQGTVPVHDELVGIWSPPEAGIYDLTMEAWDKAGNFTQYTVPAYWFAQSSLGLVQLRERFFSPNGDGRQDLLTLDYEAYQPLNVSIEIRDVQDHVVSAYQHTLTAPGQYVYEWDGSDNQGQAIADGRYVLQLNGRRLDFVIDTVPPNLSQLEPGGDQLPAQLVCEYETLQATTVLPHISYPSAALSVAAQEQNWRSVRFQARNRTEQVGWVDAGAPLKPAEPESYAMWRFPSAQWGEQRHRVVAEDLAANVSIVEPVLAEPFISAISFNGGLMGESYSSGTKWLHEIPRGELTTFFSNTGIDLGYVLLEVIDPRVEGGPMYLVYEASPGNSRVLELVDVPQSPDESLGPNSRCSLRGARVMSAPIPRLFPGTTRFMMTSNHQLVEPNPRRGEGFAFSVSSACFPPSPSDDRCALFSSSSIVVPLLWCPREIPVEFNSASFVVPGFDDFWSEFAVPEEADLVGFGDSGCHDSPVQGVPVTCPEGFDCSCVRLDLSAYGPGDIYTHSRVPSAIAQDPSFGIAHMSLFVGKLSEEQPLVELDSPANGSSVCNGTSLAGVVGNDESLPSLHGIVRFEGLALPALNVQAHNAPAVPSLLHRYPGLGEGVVASRELRFGPVEGIDDINAVFAASPLFSLPGGGLGRLTDGAALDFELWGNGCFGRGPSLHRRFFADFGANVDELRLSSPIGVGPPFVSGFERGPRLGFSPASGSGVELSVQLLEEFAGTVSVIDVATQAPVRTLRSGEFPSGVLVVGWSGDGDDGLPVTDGVYAFQVDLTDQCGHPYVGKTPFYVDGSAPIVDFLAPLSGSAAAIEVPIKLQIDELRPSQVTVELRRFDPVDGYGPWVPLVVDNLAVNGVFDWVWEASLYRPGMYELRARAIDEVGNVGEWSGVDVAVPHHPELIVSAVANPKLISPNGDGVLDGLALDLLLSQSVALSVDVVRPNGTWVVSLGTQSNSTGSYHALWDGLDSSSEVVADGEYFLRVRAGEEGSASGYQEALVRVQVDTIGPAIRLLDEPQPYVRGTDEWIVEFDDIHPSRWEVSTVSVIPNLVSEGTRFGEQTVLSWQGVAEGEHLIGVQAFDAAGNHTEQSFATTLDLTPPDALISFPEDGALVTRGSLGVEILGFADDLHLAQWELEVETAGGDISILAGGSGAMDGPLGRWLAGGSDGVYRLRLRVVDLAGNQAEHEIGVTLDNTPPEVALQSPVNDSWLGGQFTANGSVSDAHLSGYVLEISPRSPTPQWQTIASGESALSNALIANVLAPQPDGSYVLRLRAQDRVGLTGEAFVDVEIDTGPPDAPLNLTGERQGQRDVRLSWSASTAPDVAAYRLYRDGQIRFEGAEQLHLDLAVSDGVHAYFVTAVDRAGNESPASNAVDIRIDTTPPDVLIHSPPSLARVRGEVAIRGKAHSQEDFERYRLSLTSVGGSSLLAEAGSPVLSGILGRWDSRSQPDGDYGLRLEAWDLSQNRAEALVAFVVDNTPPAAPTGVVATVVDNDVDLSWQANSEPDLAGYLIYRGAVLLNGDPNADPGSIVYTQTTHRIDDLGDGSHDFRVIAVDTTGNLSDPSSPTTAEVEGHPPRVTLVRPAPGTVFEMPVLTRGSTTDQDIVEVLLQYRLEGTGTWINFGLPYTEPPYERSFLPPDLAYGHYQLRALATDNEGLTDPDPPSVAVEYRDLTAPDAPLALAASVDGGTVDLSWAAPQASDVDRYRIERQPLPQGSWQSIGEVPVPQLSLLDEDLADGRYLYRVLALDGFDNASPPSATVEVRIYTPHLQQPYAPGNQPAVLLTARSPVAGQAELERIASNGSEPLSAPMLAADVEVQLPVNLLRGLNEFHLRVVDTAGNRSKAATVVGGYDADPVAPSGLSLQVSDHDVSLQWSANPEDSIRGYRLFRAGASVLADVIEYPVDVRVYTSGGFAYSEPVLFDGDPGTISAEFLSSERDRYFEAELPADALIVAMQLHGLPNWDATHIVRLDGYWQDRWIELPATVERTADSVRVIPQQPYVASRIRVALRSATEFADLPIGEIDLRVRPLFDNTSHVETLADGAYLYRVSAVNDYGFEGPRSDAVEAQVGDAQPPDAVVLSGGQIEADVSLSWTASTAPDLAAYRLYRRGQLLFETTDLDQRSYLDAALANGVYDYQLFAVDQVGNAAGSNVLVYTITGTLPATPLNLSVQPVDGGGALRLHWSPGMGASATQYQIGRSLQLSGPFQPLAQVPATPTEYTDAGLQNGTRYYYVVAALDARGNRSADSNVANGVPFANQRLATPVFEYPTQHDQSLTLPGPATTLAGTAEADSGLLIGYRDEVLPLLMLPANPEQIGVGYGAERMAFGVDGAWAWLDFGYSAFLQPLDPDGGEQIELGQSCARAQWLTADELLHCDGQTSPERLLRIAADNPAQSQLYLSQPGIRGFALSADIRQLLLLASFDWPDGSRESLALRSDGGPFVELPVDTGDIDADLLQIDPTGRWVLLRRLSDERVLLMTLASGVVVETDLVLAQRTAAAFHPDLSIAVLAAAGPMGQGIYQLDLQSAQLEWLDLGLAYPTGTGFSPDGGFLDVLGSDQWRRHRWPQLTLQQTLEVYEAERLQALGTGEAMLSTADGYGQLSWLRPAGVFRVDGVPLAPGENLMTALSTRPGQLNSFPALPITILVPTDGLPDLEVRASDLSLLPNQVRPGDQPRLGARVRNLGSGPSAQASANLVLSTPAGGLTQPPRVIPPLQPGDETLLVWQLPALDLAGPYLALVQLDPAGELVERSTANNRAQLGFAVSADGAPELQLSAQPTLLAPTQRLNGEVQILPGGLALNGRLRVRVVSPAGQLVAGLIDQPVSVPAVGSLPAQALQWTPGTIAAGDYLLQASLLDLQGSLRAQQVLPLSVTAFRTLTMSSSARVASVPSGMPIHLDTQLHFVAGNAAIEDPVLRARLETVEGDVLAEAEQALPTLLPGYSGSLESLLLPDPAAPAGQYLLRAELWTQGLLAESAAVQLITEPTASPLLEGGLAVPAVPLPIGEPVNIALQVRNTGDVALNGIPLRATLRRSLQAAPLATLEQSIDLAIGAEWNGQLAVPAHLLALGDQLVSLSVIDGPQAGVLAFGSFRVVDALAPALSVVAPSPGSIVPARFRLDARAIDQHHPVGAVRVRRNGQEWLPMAPGVDFAGHHQRLLGPLADGPLSLQLDAEDAVGNRVEIGPVVYTVDATPPLVQISGVEDGGLYNGARTPQVTITELHPASEQILLNGQPYVSGTPVSSEDQYTLYVLARDAAGNEGSAIVSFELDLTPPPVAFSAPAAGSVIATPTTQVLISSEPLAQVMLTPATGGSLQAQADAQGVASFSDVPLLEGSNLLLATASDAAGNVSAPAELQLTRSAATINAVQGSLALAAVFEPPAAVAGGWQLQNLTTLDLSALPLRIELRQAQGGALLAQQALTVDLLPSGALQADFSFSSDGRPLGTYAIALLAQLRDEQSQQIWIELAQESVELADLTAPSLQWLAPQADQLVGAEPELRASVTDTLSGVDRVELMLDGQPAGLLAQDDLQPDQYLAQPGPLNDGPYLAALQAFDLAGNTVASERAFVVDATPPLIQIDGVADDQLSNQPLSPQIDIIEPHLASSEILLDGQPYFSGTPVTGEGAHLLSVSAVDQLGNSASRQISFTLDFTPPALAFLSPPDGLEIIAAHLPAELQSEPQALVELRAGANQQTASTAADGRAQFAAVPLQLGPNTLLASATDAAGNRSPEVGVTVIRVRPIQAVIEGFLTLLSTTVNHGEPLQGGFQIGNGGGFDPGPVTILVRIHSGSTLLHELSWPQLLPPSAIASEAFSLPSDDWPLGTLRMELRWRAEDEPDATPVLIDQRLLIVRDGTAPLVAILDPPDGTVVGSAPQVVASASDTLSEIAEASVRVNGGPWQAMAPAGQPDQYQASPFLPLIGYNLIEVRATDSAQNIGFATPIILCRSSSLGEPGDGLFSGLFEGQDQLFADSFEGSECDPPPLLRRALRWAQPTAAAAAEGAR